MVGGQRAAPDVVIEVGQDPAGTAAGVDRNGLAKVVADAVQTQMDDSFKRLRRSLKVG